MARTVPLACARCGHLEMLVVESAENEVAEIECASHDRITATDETSVYAAVRARRLESLPTSLPVGGIITPV